MSTESSDRLVFRRRKPLQTLGGYGVVGLTGCSGDTESDPSENDEDTESNTTPEETTDSEPDYSLPESEHANPVDMATEWMIFPDDQEDDLEKLSVLPPDSGCALKH